MFLNKYTSAKTMFFKKKPAISRLSVPWNSKINIIEKVKQSSADIHYQVTPVLKLPEEDSNPQRQNQNLQCYQLHYRERFDKTPEASMMHQKPIY